MREKIAFLIHQYGLEVNGGAETHCRLLAEHLLPYYEVEVLTSTSMKPPFKSYYPVGIDDINGVTVRRFELCAVPDFDEMQNDYSMALKGISGADEKWIRNLGPYCPDLIAYLIDNSSEYKAVIVMCYNYWHSFAALSLELKNVIFIPLAHDEFNIYQPIYKTMFFSAKCYLYNTFEERYFIKKAFHVDERKYHVKCMGIEISQEGAEARSTIPKLDNYIIYAGRVTKNKNYAELNKYFIEYKKRHPSDLKLVVLGRVSDGMIVQYHEDIQYMGFVSEEEKHAYMKAARFLVLPSKNESLSIVLLESFINGRPVLVNGYSPVLRGHCQRSNAGLYYMGFVEFEAEMDYLLGNEEICIKMGQNGKRYVEENYSWDKVIDGVVDFIEDVASQSGR